MRLAIITDVHEDFSMLEKAIQKLESIGYDMLICLGDITGYAREFYDHNADANSCIDLLREYADIAVAGNHDLFNSQRLPSYYQDINLPDSWYMLPVEQQRHISNNKIWLYEEEIIPKLTPVNMEYLKNLKEVEVVENGHTNIMFSHFLKPDIAGMGKWYPYRINELANHFRLMQRNDSKLAFIGHSHPNGVAFAGKLFWSAPRCSAFKIKKNPRIIFCPAIAGEKNSCSLLVFDIKKYEITPFII